MLTRLWKITSETKKNVEIKVELFNIFIFANLSNIWFNKRQPDSHVFTFSLLTYILVEYMMKFQPHPDI